MTRADLAALLAAADVTDVDIDAAMADEHVRSSAYRQVVSAVAEGPRGDLDEIVVRVFLRDPVNVVAKSAVVAFIDAVAPTFSDSAGFERWAAALAPEFEHLATPTEREFVRHRIHDWTTYLAIASGEIPAAADLATTSNWMQSLLASESTSLPVLAALAESGSTKKIRNAAQNRAGSRQLRDGR
ncbi:hypothetical protein [Actinokineospora diospyrosa]|uniref:Uncharacterized protein n=1 Tax=Actinokineospora diospyrosa TaxID=103728 RepID=A0ABT1IC58_9PSEU|nr:hypothetical protein [Actinokineospora diospyrosa]MCP2270222.1 hypothetical protein [Actinokineospora diospyrosa]